MTVTENAAPEHERPTDSTHEMMVAIIKPDGLPNKDAIIERIVEEGFKLLQEKTFQLTLDQATEIYGNQNDYSSIKEFIEWVSSSDVCALLIEKENAVIDFTELLGSKNSSKAKKKKPRSLRALFGKDRFYNAVDGSESLEDAHKEVSMFFDQSTKKPVDSANETKSEIVNNPLPSPAVSPVTEKSPSSEVNLGDVSQAQENASVEPKQIDPTNAEKAQEKERSNVHDAVKSEHITSVDIEAPQPKDSIADTNTPSTPVEQNDLMIEQVSAAQVESNHVTHTDSVEQPVFKTEEIPKAVEESEKLPTQEEENTEKVPKTSEEDIPRVESQPQKKEEEAIQEQNHNIENKGGVPEPLQHNDQSQIEQADDVNQSKDKVQELAESAPEQEKVSSEIQEPAQQDAVPEPEVLTTQKVEVEVPKQQEARDEVETEAEAPVQQDASANVEESKQEQSAKPEENKPEEHQVVKTEEDKQTQAVESEDVKPEPRQSVKSKIKELEQKSNEAKIEEPKQLNNEVSAETPVHGEKPVDKLEVPEQQESLEVAEKLVIKENTDKPEELEELEKKEETNEAKKSEEPNVEDKTHKTIPKKNSTSRDTATSGTTNTSAGRSKNSSTKTEPSPKPSPISSKNSDRKEIKASRAPSERSDTSGSRLRQPAVKSINRSPTSSGKPPLKKVERKPIANGVSKDAKPVSRISKPAVPKETEEKKSAGTENGLKKKTLKTSKQLPRVALMSAPKPKPEDTEKDPKKTEIKKKRQSSTKDFINRLTAPTLASKNKKTDTTGDVASDATPAPKAKRPAATTRTSRVSPNDTIKKRTSTAALAEAKH